jgi:hypothetical protein
VNDAIHASRLAYIRRMGDALLLRDWDLMLSRDRASCNNHASISLHEAKNQGTISLGQDWESRTPEQQRQTITHELLHCHTARLCRTMTRLAEKDKRDLIEYVDASFDNEEEIVIDALSRVLAPFMPLPGEDLLMETTSDS